MRRFSRSRSRTLSLLAALVLIGALTGCGQKGALYLPPDPAPVPATAAEPADAEPAAAEPADAAEQPAPVEPADPAEEADKHVA